MKNRLLVAKIGTVLLTGITNLLGLSGVLSLNSEHYLAGCLAVGGYLILTMFDTFIYLWILEQITKGGKDARN